MAWGRHRDLLKPGSLAPAILLERLDGGEVKLQEMVANGPALLAFFKVDCPVCQLTVPFLARLHSPGTLSIWGVSQNGSEDARTFQREFRITFPILLDSERDGFRASNGFGISRVPSLFLVERDGTVAKAFDGWSRKDIAEIGALAGINPFDQGDALPEWKAG